MSELDDSLSGLHLAETLYKFSQERKYTDFKLRAGNTTLFCHKNVLCAQSSYFDSLCLSGLNEATLDKFVSSEEDGQALTQVVRFLYLETIDLTKDTVEVVLQAADFIKCEKLKSTCERFMISELDLQNIKKYSEVARELNLSELSESCVQCKIDNFSLLTTYEWFLQELSADEWLQCLQDDNLNAKTKDEVLDALCKWLKNTHVSNAKKEEYVDQLCPYVRLTQCRKTTLQTLLKDDTLPSALKVKLFDHLYFGETSNHVPRTSYTAGSANGEKQKHGKEQIGGDSQTPRTPAIQQQRGSEDDDLEEKVVIVAEQSTGYREDTTITYLDNEKRSIKITNTSLHNTVSVSVCATTDKIIFSGGYQFASFLQDAKCLSKVHQFSAHSCKWSQLPDLVYPRKHHSSTCIHNQLYVIGDSWIDEHGNEHHTEVHVLDLNSRSWSIVKTMPAENIVYRPSLAVIGTDIVVAYSNKTLKYQTLLDQWEKCQDIPAYVHAPHNSTVAVGHKVFVLDCPYFLAYDTVEDQWTNTCSTNKTLQLYCDGPQAGETHGAGWT